MKNEFVPYDIALALKELGFDEKCLADFMVFGDNESVDGKYGKTEPKLFTEGQERELEFERKDSGFPFIFHSCKAPLYQQAFRWFREKYDLKGYPVYRSLLDDSEQWWDWLIIGEEITYKKYNTYEEAQDACLRKLIEIIKEELN